eukprot:1182599-Prorocentrum_minimum.AAC.2
MARRCLSVHGLAVVSRRRVPNRDINVALSFIIGYSETRNPNPNPNPNPLSSVMDDNKMLTLASNERIPLRACMRLIVETAHLTNATPATVSRGGVLYLNAGDIGWAPFARSCPLHLSNASVTAAVTLPSRPQVGPLCAVLAAASRRRGGRRRQHQARAHGDRLVTRDLPAVRLREADPPAGPGREGRAPPGGALRQGADAGAPAGGAAGAGQRAPRHRPGTLTRPPCGS